MPFQLHTQGVDKLANALQEFDGDAESVINDVLHNEAGDLAQEAIRRLMPTSGKRWRGKKPAAKSSKSMQNDKANLELTVRNTSSYAYLYFPNDGSNTRRHVGQQFFFERGGESVVDDIIDRCVEKLVNKL